MVKIKKKLSDEDVLEVLDVILSRFIDSAVNPKNVKAIRTKLIGLLEVVKVVESKTEPKKKIGVVNRIQEDKVFSPGQQGLQKGEILFGTLRELLEVVRTQFEAGMQFRQYCNPISQLIGYATDDGNKYVINIVELRKDSRADSFTFNPMKLLEA